MGYRVGGELNREKTDGFYWSSTKYEDVDGVAYNLGFGSDNKDGRGIVVHYNANGFNVRCVLDK
ncbi:MAG: DUF1566 domain-containing protein [Prevotellaceae bacterium]|nr:DUF1566 domain-containing protein [Prevotellaceae bacterium]